MDTYRYIVCLLIPTWVAGVWSLSQLYRGKRQGTPRMGRQSIAGLTYKIFLENFEKFVEGVFAVFFSCQHLSKPDEHNWRSTLSKSARQETAVQRWFCSTITSAPIQQNFLSYAPHWFYWLLLTTEPIPLINKVMIIHVWVIKYNKLSAAFYFYLLLFPWYELIKCVLMGQKQRTE